MKLFIFLLRQYWNVTCGHFFANKLSVFILLESIYYFFSHQNPFWGAPIQLISVINLQSFRAFSPVTLSINWADAAVSNLLAGVRRAKWRRFPMDLAVNQRRLVIGCTRYLRSLISIIPTEKLYLFVRHLYSAFVIVRRELQIAVSINYVIRLQLNWAIWNWNNREDNSTNRKEEKIKGR